MKFLVATLLTVVSISANAQTAPNQQTLLKELLGSKAKQAAQGDRWLQFANGSGVVEVANVQKSVSLTVRNGDQEISDVLNGEKSNLVKIEKRNDGTKLITVDNFVDHDGKHQLYSTTTYSVSAEQHEYGYVSAVAERKTFLEWTFDGKASHLVALANPKIEKVQASGSYLLTLSQTKMDKLGLAVKKHMNTGERRQFGGGQCTVRSEHQEGPPRH